MIYEVLYKMENGDTDKGYFKEKDIELFDSTEGTKVYLPFYDYNGDKLQSFERWENYPYLLDIQMVNRTE